jgi:adenosine deaminase
MVAMDWFEKVPKVELHLHLEGAIPHAALWQLVQKYGGDPSVRKFEDLRALFEYRDFPQFLDTWVWKNGYLREYEDFEFIAETIARNLTEQNVQYVEAFYSPSDFACHGLQTQRLTEAIRAGLDQVPGIEIALVADLVRNYGPDQATLTLRDVQEVCSLGVIGIGLGGSEQEYPPELFQNVFHTARTLGFFTTAHAGEVTGAQSVRRAINDLQIDRIGHGVRANEDEELLELLAVTRLPLEMCPISNIRTGVVASLDKHPIRSFFERGILVTVNTDDPEMFGNTLAQEYRLLEQELGFSRTQTRQLILNGIEASWMPPDRKQLMKQSFQTDPLWTG